jgi:hypothetical protein
MFGHSGWCATLEDWFDPKRLNQDYVPTGFKPYGASTYPVTGHPFGLNLSAAEKTDLIAFLKTLQGSLRQRPEEPGGEAICPARDLTFFSSVL